MGERAAEVEREWTERLGVTRPRVEPIEVSRRSEPLIRDLVGNPDRGVLSLVDEPRGERGDARTHRLGHLFEPIADEQTQIWRDLLLQRDRSTGPSPSESGQLARSTEQLDVEREPTAEIGGRVLERHILSLRRHARIERQHVARAEQARLFDARPADEAFIAGNTGAYLERTGRLAFGIRVSDHRSTDERDNERGRRNRLLREHFAGYDRRSYACVACA